MNQPDYDEEELNREFGNLMSKMGKINDKHFKLNYIENENKLNNFGLYREFNKLDERIDKLSCKV